MLDWRTRRLRRRAAREAAALERVLLPIEVETHGFDLPHGTKLVLVCGQMTQEIEEFAARPYGLITMDEIVLDSALPASQQLANAGGPSGNGLRAKRSRIERWRRR